MPHASRKDAVLARSHLPQMYESKIGFIPTAGNPSMHSTQMAINAIPHHFAYESADRLETIDAIELGHPKRSVVAVTLINQLTVFYDVRFSAAGGYAWVPIHSINQDFEIARRKPQIQIEFA